MGKLLFVELGKKTMKKEPLGEKTCREPVNGDGRGAKILYEKVSCT